MPFLPDNRALWLSRSILPYERGLRLWLAQRGRLASHDVDDVVQETYAALASLKSIEHIRDPRSYMFQTAKSILLQQLRRSKIVSLESLNELDLLKIPTAAPAPDDLASQRQELLFVAKLIAAFPAKCREAFTLRKFYGLSQCEISRKLGISENTVEKHIAKGIRLLMDALKRSNNRADSPPLPGSELRTLAVDVATRTHNRD